MQHESTGIRFLSVAGLGYEAAIIDIEGETLLLVDAALDSEERIEVMTRAMAQVSD